MKNLNYRLLNTTLFNNWVAHFVFNRIHEHETNRIETEILLRITKKFNTPLSTVL